LTYFVTEIKNRLEGHEIPEPSWKLKRLDKAGTIYSLTIYGNDILQIESWSVAEEDESYDEHDCIRWCFPGFAGTFEETAEILAKFIIRMQPKVKEIMHETLIHLRAVIDDGVKPEG
jgi:hypothetical protein